MEAIQGDKLRGHLEAMVLSTLERGEAHGLEILHRLEEAGCGLLGLVYWPQQDIGQGRFHRRLSQRYRDRPVPDLECGRLQNLECGWLQSKNARRKGRRC